MDFYISLLFCCLCERISKVHHIVHKDVRQSQMTVAVTTMLQMPMDVIWNMSMTRGFFGTGTNDNKTCRKKEHTTTTTTTAIERFKPLAYFEYASFIMDRKTLIDTSISNITC